VIDEPAQQRLEFAPRRRRSAQETDASHRLALLRVRRERPRGDRAEECYERTAAGVSCPGPRCARLSALVKVRWCAL
jgi:hypothetical protein